MFLRTKIATSLISSRIRLTTGNPFARASILMSLLTVCSLLPHQAPLCETSPFSNGPKTIASKERVTVLIDREIKESKSFIVLKISVPTDSKANAFLLSDPARLVVDFEGASIKKSENFPAPANGVIKQIRLGAHPSKLRVVVDLVKSTPPEYDWKADKRHVTITFAEGIAPEASTTQTAALPTLAPTPAATSTPNAPATPATPAPPANTVAATPTTPATATATPLPQAPDANVAQDNTASAAAAAAGAGLGSNLEFDDADDSADLGDLEATRSGPPPTRVPTTFSIKGYKFEYLPDRSPVLKIILNKPRAQAQISKVDSETYAISIKDCGVENEDLELPQFPPHDFVGFVMVVSEVVGKNIEVSVSVEEGIVLGTSVHDNEIWVKKP